MSHRTGITSFLRALATAGSSVALFVLTACGGADKSTSVPPRSIVLTAPAAAPTIQAGASGTATISIARGGGDDAEVTIAITNLPTGITATAEPSIVRSDVTQSVITVNVGTGVAAGSYTFIVTATASGLASSQVTVPLLVTATGATPMVLTGPTALSVASGSNATGSFTLARNGNAGDVTLSAENLPSGVTANFAPATLTGSTTTSTMTVSAGAGAAASTKTITVRAKGTGMSDAVANVALTIVPSSTGGSAVALQFCSSELPVWVGYQSGTGAWARAIGSGGTFNATIDTRGAVAYVERSGTTYDLTVAYGTVAELKSAGAALCAGGQTGTKRVSGSVAGVALTQFANVALGPEFTTVMPFMSTNFSFDSVPNGALDLIAARVNLDMNSGSTSVDRIILRRGLNPANGSTLPVLDFGASEAFAPASAKLTIGNLGADTAYAATGLFGAMMGPGFGFTTEIRGPVDYSGLPSTKLLAGEFQYMLMGAQAAGDEHATRSAIVYFRDVANRTVAFGAPLAAVTVTNLGSSAALRPQASFDAQADYGSMAIVSFEQSTRIARVSVSKAYLGGAPTRWTVAVPDLSGAPGWDSSWNLRSSTGTTYAAEAYGGDLAAIIGGAPSNGGQLLYASRDGTAFGAAARSISPQASHAVSAPRGLGRRAKISRPASPPLH